MRLGVFLINNLTLFADNDMYFDFGYLSVNPNDTVWAYEQLPNVDFLLCLHNFYSDDASTSRLNIGWQKGSNSST